MSSAKNKHIKSVVSSNYHSRYSFLAERDNANSAGCHKRINSSKNIRFIFNGSIATGIKREVGESWGTLPSSQFSLSWLYVNGEGVTPSPVILNEVWSNAKG